METKNTVLNNGTQWDIVKHIRKHFPHILAAVFSNALIIESIGLCQSSRFVVSSCQCDSVSVSDFEGNEEAYGLHGVVSPINIVSKEEVVGVWNISTDGEEFYEIM